MIRVLRFSLFLSVTAHAVISNPQQVQNHNSHIGDRRRADYEIHTGEPGADRGIISAIQGHSRSHLRRRRRIPDAAGYG
jgi:hypothetical protein